VTRAPRTRPPDYLDQAERHAGRRLACRDEVALLLGAAADPALSGEFEQALFLAKFWEGAAAILRRSGPGGEDVSKVAAELSDATARLSGIIGKLFDSAAPGAAAAFRRRFLPAEAGTMEPLRALISDLALLKNFELHGAAR
jgi:hypothetical protein